MDANAALKEIRETIKDLDGADQSSQRYRGLVDDFIGTVSGLDDSLSRGGFLPEEWATNTADASDVNTALQHLMEVQDYMNARQAGGDVFVRDQISLAMAALKLALSVSK